MTAPESIPNDANGQVLRRMLQEGDDLTVARPVDFEHVLPNRKAGKAMEQRARALGYEVHVARRGLLTRERDVRCVRTMVPTHSAIGGAEARLAAIARSLGGHEDGWGCMLPVGDS